MNDQAAFLAGIFADRADDTVRLVYADWLEEHDQAERAEFIRLGCQFARDRFQSGRQGKQLLTITDRLSDLLEAHHGEWFPFIGWTLCGEWEIAGNLENGLPWAFINRGFIEALICPSYMWLDREAEMLAAPPVERVTLIYGGFGIYDPRSLVDVRASLKERWPGIEFEVQGPPA